MHDRSVSRAAAMLYLIPTILGPFSLVYVHARVWVEGDAAATAARVLASESLVRAGAAASVVIVLAEIALCGALFRLFEGVSVTGARVATYARLTMTVLQALNIALPLTALALARSRVGAFDRCVLLLFEGEALIVRVWECCFALHLLVLGALVFRCGFIRRAFGVGLVIAALGYGLEGVGAIVAPESRAAFAAIVAVTALVGELPFVFALLRAGFGRGRDAAVAAG
ncbi:MAG: DUF4386 domain-containing protein [Myxococcales bacterium]|nr:DUF4386 domain-containing protein [Myxococcales bacterium]